PDTKTVVVTGQQLTSNTPLEVEVAFPRALLADTVTRPAWQSEDTPPTLPTALGAGQPTTDPGSYNPAPYDPGSYNPTPGDSGPSFISSFNPTSICGPFGLVCGAPILLLILSGLG